MKTLANTSRIRKVTFKSHGQTLVGNLYLPKDYVEEQVLPGVIVTGSWTSIKEQMSGLYAKELADRGFAALAFDFRNFGESEGEVRTLESPKMKSEDIHAAAEFLATLPEIDRVGGMAICASAGYMAQAIAQGAPLQSFATVAAWLHDPETARAIYTPEYYDRLMSVSQAAKTEYERNGTIRYTLAATNDETVEFAAMCVADPDFYYTNPDRGAIPEYDNRFPVMAWSEWLTFNAFSAAPGIHIPYLMLHGDGMMLPDNAKAFYEAIDAPKSLKWQDGLQMDYYDKPELVASAATQIAEHFQKTLC
ncbi:MAG: alpha/beta hydrolase [Cyanobacteria bacterium P01_E01_bin.42]